MDTKNFKRHSYSFEERTTKQIVFKSGQEKRREKRANQLKVNKRKNK